MEFSRFSANFRNHAAKLLTLSAVSASARRWIRFFRPAGGFHSGFPCPLPSLLLFFSCLLFPLAPRAPVQRGRFDPVNPRAPRGRKESADKPGSVWGSHSSGMRVAAQLKRPTRKPHVGHMCGLHAPRASLFGLAPGGVCRAADVATRAVRSYRTISPLPAPLARHLGGIFLLHFPWARAPQALPGTLPCGARTFLHALAHTATAWPTLGAHHTHNRL